MLAISKEKITEAENRNMIVLDESKRVEEVDAPFNTVES